MSQSLAVPPLYMLLKDHKRMDPEGLYPTRPVISSAKGMNLHLNDILHEILQPIQENIRESI